ncbi:hypothetical protein [Vibrio mytili]|nr:hypothetical protein [Vibrio mytili]
MAAAIAATMTNLTMAKPKENSLHIKKEPNHSSNPAPIKGYIT